jgi:putative hydrolase of the HAD superfamily
MNRPPLILVDLDNTLIDRDAAFRSAAAAFLHDLGHPASDLAWIMTRRLRLHRA